LNPLFDGDGSQLHWLGSDPVFSADLAIAGYEAPR
jgi:hypothetical protein